MIDEYVEIEELLGKTLTSVEVGDEGITLTTKDGEAYKMHHYQDCCESVYVEDVVGDINDLIGEPVLEAQVVTNFDNPKKEWSESHTWTFYKLGTRKGRVTIRWYGESNGYYSETVSFATLGCAAKRSANLWVFTIFKNWIVHNLFGHPLAEIAKWLFGAKGWRFFHDGTLPQGAAPLYRFEIYPCGDEGETVMGAEVVVAFESDDVDQAFSQAKAWVFDKYQDDDSPNYHIVSKFGRLSP
jgi:hypothetical protein